MDMMDKVDSGGPSGEEEICLNLPQQSAAPTPRQEWTENVQDAEPDGVNIAIALREQEKTPRGAEGKKRSWTLGNGPQQWRRREVKIGPDRTWKKHRPNRHSVSSTSHRDHQKTCGNDDGTTGALEAKPKSASFTRGKQI